LKLRFTQERQRTRNHVSRSAFARLVVAGGMLASAVGCASNVARQAEGSSSRPYVIVVSLDALRHDYLDRYHPPTLERLASQGIRASALIPPFPSKTFPSHYTIATGLYPGHHGIVGNNFYDERIGRWFRIKDTLAARDGSWYGGEPIWVAAEREGVRTASYFWPGSEGEVLGVRPNLYKAYHATVPDSQRVDESVAWLRLAAAQRPHLLMLYFSDVDDTTHHNGPDTPHTANAVAVVDRALHRLLDSLAVMPIRDSVNLVVVSDHGMADVRQDQLIPLRPLLVAGGIDTSLVRMGDNGPSMSLWFGGNEAVKRRTLAVLNRGLTHARAYARGDTPSRWHLDGNARAGDVIVVAELGYIVAGNASDRFLDRGSHGWDPAYEQMRGIFIASGPRIRPAGMIPVFDNVHIYPFLAALLGLKHTPRTDADARVLAPYLRLAGD
jgi:predicted AlkP superfamily pyrophosphatase or phosphodiesterase